MRGLLTQTKMKLVRDNFFLFFSLAIGQVHTEMEYKGYIKVL